MPWCESCDKFLSPSTVDADGTCPTCGSAVDAPEQVTRRNHIPWHFWVLFVAALGYLAWRAVDGFNSLF